MIMYAPTESRGYQCLNRSSVWTESLCLGGTIGIRRVCSNIAITIVLVRRGIGGCIRGELGKVRGYHGVHGARKKAGI